MAKFAAYLFDMDGLLLDSERVYQDVAVSLLRDMGFDSATAEAEFLTLVGNSGARALARITEIVGDQDKAVVFNTAMHAGVRDSLASHVPLRPKARESLEHLAGQGARMAVVTSTHGHAARQHLKSAGLIDFFDSVTGGDEVSANKPHPAPYLEAAAGLGVDPHECAAFEDSDPGITAAITAGCTGVQIPDLRPVGVPLPQLGQHIAPDLWSALALLDSVETPIRTGTAP